MTGTIPLPASVTITQNDVGLRVSISVSGSVIPPPGLPVYPLASDPGQTWDLQDANGVLTWVQFTAPPGQKAFGLENAGGVVLLEDGAGVLLMEQ